MAHGVYRESQDEVADGVVRRSVRVCVSVWSRDSRRRLFSAGDKRNIWVIEFIYIESYFSFLKRIRAITVSFRIDLSYLGNVYAYSVSSGLLFRG